MAIMVRSTIDFLICFLYSIRKDNIIITVFVNLSVKYILYFTAQAVWVRLVLDFLWNFDPEVFELVILLVVVFELVILLLVRKWYIGNYNDNPSHLYILK